MRNEHIKANGSGGLRRLVRLIALSLIISGGGHRNSSRRDWEKMEERLGKLLPVIREVVEALAMIQIDNT